MREYTDNLTDLSKKSVSDFALYNCGMEQCRPGQFYGPRRRDYHFMHFVLAGEGVLEIQQEAYPVTAGQLFIVPAGEVSTYRASRSNPWKYCWIGFLGFQSGRFLGTLMQCGSPQFVLDCHNAAYYGERIENVLVLGGGGLGKHLRANGMLYDVIGTLLDENGADEPERFGFSVPFLARQYMELHYHDPLRITQVADAVGVHVNYLADIFRRAYKVSPKQFLSALRVKKAKELLSSTDDPIYIVANSVGFSDPLAFSKFFRRAVGESPTDYRAHRRDYR